VGVALRRGGQPPESYRWAGSARQLPPYLGHLFGQGCQGTAPWPRQPGVGEPCLGTCLGDSSSGQQRAGFGALVGRGGLFGGALAPLVDEGLSVERLDEPADGEVMLGQGGGEVLKPQWPSGFVPRRPDQSGDLAPLLDGQRQT
jgi:hypothetical protein